MEMIFGLFFLEDEYEMEYELETGIDGGML